MSNSIETFEAKISFSHLLELAVDNDVEGFKLCIQSNPDAVDEIGLWYGRQVGGQGMVLEHRTPLMVAAMYGSLDVVKVILSLSEENINRSCSPDKSTALHCAASGGSVNAVDAVKLLLVDGADPKLADANGNRPYDVINVSRMLPQLRVALEDLLTYHGCGGGLKVDSPSSPMASKCNDNNAPPVCEKKEYPIDPSFPDIKNSIYSTDEFRMYSFKVRPCSRAYSHDWTECPFVHPGENARRRDPRKYHYSCVPCPDFRKGSCRRGDMCEYAHGVFECWLHPAQYRTRLCKDGTSCNRRVCFFAHTPDELRPLYASMGSAVPSPRASVMDMAAALNIFPGSPSSMSQLSTFSPPMSPSGNWQQQNIPTLHLPGSNVQTSRLRSSLNARDIPCEELQMEQRHIILNDMSLMRSKTMTPSNLDEIFSKEVSSPRYSSPSHKSAVLNHFQLQQSMLSPINTKVFTPKSVDHPVFGQSSPMMISPRGMMEPHSPLSARLSALALREKQQQQFRSLSVRDLGSSLPRDLVPEVGSWSRWEQPSPTNGRPDWSIMKGDELNRLNLSYTMGHGGDEPDVSWVQSLVKDSPSENKDDSDINTQVESVDHSTLGAWLDQIAAQ